MIESLLIGVLFFIGSWLLELHGSDRSSAFSEGGEHRRVLATSADIGQRDPASVSPRGINFSPAL